MMSKLGLTDSHRLNDVPFAADNKQKRTQIIDDLTSIAR